MPEIEFVDPDPEPGQDEELTTGPRRDWSPRTKRAVRISAAAILAVVAGSVLSGVLRHSSSTPAAAPNPTGPTPSGPHVLAPEAPSGAFRVDHLGSAAPEGARPGTLVGRPPSSSSSIITVVLPDCPDTGSCDIDLSVPDGVRAALTAALPGTADLSVASVLAVGSHPRLRTRQISAREGRLNVRVRVAAAAAHELPHGESATVGAGTTVSATAVERGLAVTVTVSGPDTLAPGLGTVRALAADPRLLTVD